ncbi:allophanate hydrolase subunit 1 [Paenarthrobacter sp. TE4293]|uniref:carboxyltransferase domain-containing protein n=1 Tax=Paenarthrobacter sp. TE4293 TaxID=3381695 RepID=UPI003D196963
MTAPAGITFLPARPGNLLIRVGHQSGSGRYLLALRDMVESLNLLGVTRMRALKDGLHIAYDVRIVDTEDLEDMLTAADAAVRFARGDHTARIHTLSVSFDGPGSIDLPVASLLLGTSETGLIRRLCRTGHVVAALTAPAAAPVVDVTATKAMSASSQACRSRKAVLHGTLLLSDAGITIAALGGFSNEYQVGRVVQRGTTPPQRLHIGDFVRFQHASPQKPNESIPQECTR